MPSEAQQTHKPLKRLTLDMTLEEHRQLKKAAVDAGMSMRELILSMLRRKKVLKAGGQ